MVSFVIARGSLPFFDGFESGDLSGWDGSSGSPVVISSPVHHDDYSGNFSSSGSWVYVRCDFSSVSSLYCLAYYNFEALPTDGHLFDLMVTVSDTGDSISLRNNGGSYEWGFSVDWGSNTYVTADPQPSVGVWYALEIGAENAGSLELWVNGVSQGSKAGCGASDYYQMLVGVKAMASHTAVGYVDCCYIDDLYIDVEAGDSFESVDNVIRGKKVTFAQNCRVNNITAYVDASTVSGSTVYLKCAIYENDMDLVFNSETSERSWSNELAAGSYTFTYSGTKPVLVAGDYFLVVWGDRNGTGTVNLYYGSGSENGSSDAYSYAANFPAVYGANFDALNYTISCSWSALLNSGFVCSETFVVGGVSGVVRELFRNGVISTIFESNSIGNIDVSRMFVVAVESFVLSASVDFVSSVVVAVRYATEGFVLMAVLLAMVLSMILFAGVRYRRENG